MVVPSPSRHHLLWVVCANVHTDGQALGWVHSCCCCVQGDFAFTDTHAVATKVTCRAANHNRCD